MAENGSLQSPSKINCRKNSSPFLNSPNLFTAFVSKGCNENDSTITSPTSILDAKPFCAVKSPKTLWDSRGVSLGLLAALIDDKPDGSNLVKCNIPKVLFGSQLKIKVPPNSSSISSNNSPNSPAEFGIKTWACHVGSSTSPPVKKPTFGCLHSGLSATEMELSEGYTCVISYEGPSPRTVHIFDDCIVERCCGVVKFSESRKEEEKDVCIDRGGSECRCKEMAMEERQGNSGPEEIFSSSV